MLNHFLLGAFIKIITGIDDTITRTPVVAHYAKTLKDKIFFSIGNFLAVMATIVLALLFADFLKTLPFVHLISAGLLVLVSVLIYFEVFEKIIKFPNKQGKFASRSFYISIALGFILSFLTLLDDLIAFIPLFIETRNMTLLAILGILSGTLLQITLIIFLAESIDKIKYKKEISAIGIFILAILVAFQIV